MFAKLAASAALMGHPHPQTLHHSRLQTDFALGWCALTGLGQFQTVSTVSAQLIEIKTPGFNPEGPTAGTLS